MPSLKKIPYNPNLLHKALDWIKGKSNVEIHLDLNWQEYSTMTEALDKSSDKVIKYAHSAWKMYAQKIWRFRIMSKFSTFLMVTLLVSGLSLEVYEIYDQNQRNQQLLIALNEAKRREVKTVESQIAEIPISRDYTTMGLIFLTIAFGVLIYDRNFGISSSYIRFVSNKVKLEHTISNFTDIWQLSTVGIFTLDGNGKITYPSGLANDLSISKYDLLKGIILEFKNEINGIIEEETEEWKANRQESRKQLESLITRKYEDLKTQQKQKQTELIARIKEEQEKIRVEDMVRTIDVSLKNMNGLKGVLRVFENQDQLGNDISLTDDYKAVTIPNLKQGLYTIKAEVEDANGNKKILTQSIDLTATRISKLLLDFS